MRLFAIAILFAAPVFCQNGGAPIENEYVRVVHATDQPHHPSAPHQHKQNRVMVYLDSGDMDIKYQDGKVEHQHWRPGQVAWSPAGGIHVSENVSDQPIRIVEIELRKEGNANEAGQAPDRTRAIIDNAQVRVYRASKPPQGGHYVAVNTSTGDAAWDQMPAGGGPVVIARLK